MSNEFIELTQELIAGDIVSYNGQLVCILHRYSNKEYCVVKQQEDLFGNYRVVPAYKIGFMDSTIQFSDGIILMLHKAVKRFRNKLLEYQNNNQDFVTQYGINIVQLQKDPTRLIRYKYDKAHNLQSSLIAA